MATIITKNSGTIGSVPTTSNLELGELALNYADGKIFLKKNDSTNTPYVVSLDADGLGKMFKYIFKASDNTGVKDVTKELNDLLTTANGQPIFIPAGIYRINDLNPTVSVNLIGFPNTVKIKYDIEYQAFSTIAQQTYQMTSPTQTSISSFTKVLSPTHGATSGTDYVSRVTVSTVTGFSIGDIAHVCSNDFEPWGDSRYGESIEILDIDSVNNYIYFAGILEFHDYYITTPYLTKFKTDRKFSLFGIDFINDSGTWLTDTTVRNGNGGWALNLWGWPRVSIKNCNFEDLWTGAITLRACPLYDVKDCQFYHIANYKTGTPDLTIGSNPISTYSGESWVYVNGSWTDGTWTTSSGSNILTRSTNTTQSIFVGAGISGTGIPSGAYVTNVLSRTQITISANATATNSGLTLTFGHGLSQGAHIALTKSSPSGSIGGIPQSEIFGNTSGSGSGFDVDLNSTVFSDKGLDTKYWFRFRANSNTTSTKGFGIVSSSTSTTLTDFRQAWTTNTHANKVVYITSGTGSGQEKTILSNTATQLTISGTWTTQPDSSSKFVISTPATSTTSGGGSNVVIDWVSGRLGYGINAYGASGDGVASNLTSHQLRHTITTGGYESTNTFSASEWINYGVPTKNTFTNIIAYNPWGPPLDLHEQGRNIVFQGCKVYWPTRSPFEGSYNGFGIQLRCSNVRIFDYYQEGGNYGVRFTATKHYNNEHILDNVTFKSIYRSGSDGYALWTNSLSSLAENQRCKVKIGKVTTIDSEIAAYIDVGHDFKINSLTVRNANGVLSSGGNEGAIKTVGACKLYVDNLDYDNDSVIESFVTSSTSTIITDSTKSFTTNEHASKRILIISGTGVGQVRTISSNTATTITVSSSFTTVPDSTSIYQIFGLGGNALYTSNGCDVRINNASIRGVGHDYTGIRIVSGAKFSANKLSIHGGSTGFQVDSGASYVNVNELICKYQSTTAISLSENSNIHKIFTEVSTTTALSLATSKTLNADTITISKALTTGISTGTSSVINANEVNIDGTPITNFSTGTSSTTNINRLSMNGGTTGLSLGSSSTNNIKFLTTKSVTGYSITGAASSINNFGFVDCVGNATTANITATTSSKTFISYLNTANTKNILYPQSSAIMRVANMVSDYRDGDSSAASYIVLCGGDGSGASDTSIGSLFLRKDDATNYPVRIFHENDLIVGKKIWLGDFVEDNWNGATTTEVYSSGATTLTWNSAMSKQLLGLPGLGPIAGLSPSADTIPYFTSSDSADITTLTTFGRSLIDDDDADAARTTLSAQAGIQFKDEGVSIGTNGAVTALDFVGSGVSASHSGGTVTVTVNSSGGGISDGDKGDITVSSSGTVWSIDSGTITYEKIQPVSATDKILGRVSASSGTIEEITFTDFAQSLADDTNDSEARATLGLGTIATQDSSNVSISGGSITNLSNTGLSILDTNASHSLGIVPGSNLTGNRTLTLTTGDANRTLTLTGDASLVGTNTGDQSLFSNIEVSGQSTVSADTTTDTLTLANGTGVQITTNATTDTITISQNANAIIRSPGISINNGGQVITTGSKGKIPILYSGTITNWYVEGDVTGSIVIDVKRSGTSIIGAGNKPTLSSATSANAAVSSWTSTSISEGDIIEYYVDSISTCTQVQLVLKVNLT